MQYYDINIPANKQQIVEAQGTFIYYLTGNAGGADPTIKVTFGLGGTSVLLKPGQSIRLPVTAKPIDMWRVENYANSATILGQVLVGTGDFKDTNTTGTVQVMDGSKARTLGKTAFTAYNGISTGGAGIYAHVQLWNPVGSGKNVFLEYAAATAQAAGFVNVRIATAALGTNQLAPNSKLMGSGAASVATMYTATNAVAQGSTIINGRAMAANGTVEFRMVEPIVLAPGNGLIFQSAANQDMSGYFEYYEESQ